MSHSSCSCLDGERIQVRPVALQGVGAKWLSSFTEVFHLHLAKNSIITTLFIRYPICYHKVVPVLGT